MDYIFLGLGIGCLAFLGKIIMDYLHEVPTWKAKVEQAEAEQVQYESQVQQYVQAKEDSAGKSKAIDDEIKTLEKMRDELKAGIEKTKQDMARKGRIVMRRQSDS